MPEASMKIGFAKKAAVPLADTEKVSLWDEASGGTLAVEDGHLCLAGTWKVSMIGNLLGSGVLGYILVRPLFQRSREEKILLPHVERVLVSVPKRGKPVYHVFQSRDGGVSEVHVFTTDAGTDESCLEQALVSVVGMDRFKKV